MLSHRKLEGYQVGFVLYLYLKLLKKSFQFDPLQPTDTVVQAFYLCA